MFIFSIYRLSKLELRWKVVQKYEKYVYVTLSLNPFPRERGLTIAPLKVFMFIFSIYRLSKLELRWKV